MNPTVTQELVPSAAGPEGPTSRPDRRLLVGYLHKTSNTLCGIKGYAGLIAERENPGGEAGRWARKIIAEVERMEEIFRSVGDLTRGRAHPDIGVDLPALVGATARGCARDHRCLDLTLGPIPAAELRLPATDLVLMLTEVLRNCAESAGAEGDRISVDIHGENRDGRLFLTVRDQGPGMEASLVAQAADPFLTTKEGHLGVGLTRVDTLMEMYGLSWRLDSRQGRGTRVVLEVAKIL